MLLFAILAICILLCVTSLHYRHHFLLQINHCISSTISPSSTISDNIQTSTTRSQCKFNPQPFCCRLIKRNEFNFFPTSFLMYLLFMIVLCVLVITVEILNYCDHNTSESVIDLLFGYSNKSYSRSTITELHHVTLHQQTAPIHLSICIIDHILIYGILISSTWESLFSFYRYYTTSWCSHNYRLIPTKLVIQKFFLYYAILFAVLFILTIHLYYFLFPLTVLLHLGFNLWCTLKFASILTERYKHFIEMDLKANASAATNTFNHDMLKSVHFMKYVSVICCVLRSMYLTLLLLTYDVNVVYYIPSIWSIQCILLSLTFVRNRQFVKQCVFEYYQRAKHAKCCCIKARNQIKEIPLKSDLNPKLKKAEHSESEGACAQTTNATISDVKSQSDYAVYNGFRIGAPPNLKEYRSHPIFALNAKDGFSQNKALQLLGLTTNSEHILNLSPAQSYDAKIWTNLGQKSHPIIYEHNHSVSPKDNNKAKSSLQSPVSVMSLHRSYDNNYKNNDKVALRQNKDEFVFNVDIEPDCESNEIKMDLGDFDINAIKGKEYELRASEVGFFQSKSAPMNKKLIKNEDAMDMFDILVKYGFYSTQRVNSAKQLKQYHLQRSFQVPSEITVTQTL